MAATRSSLGATPVEGDGPTVVFIAGSGRSGSTLLERAIGQVPGFVNVGELIDLARRPAVVHERCGCGEPFEHCTFWAAVGKRAFGGWDTEPMRELHSLRARVARQRRLPAVLADTRRSKLTPERERYASLFCLLYKAILEESGARYVVDASKWPAQAAALTHPGIDLRVLHLVRDPRGVVHSMRKSAVPRPHALDRDATMESAGLVSASLRWALVQAELDLVGLSGICVHRSSYERFVEHPEATLRIALRGLGFEPDDEWFTHIDGRRLHLRTSHGLAGNPGRFSTGAVDLTADDSWQRQMPRRSRAAVLALTAPARLRVRESSVADELSQEDAGRARESAAWPRVSVIMPTRGRPELVRASIEAVVQQDYPGDIECLVVHDQEPPDLSLSRLGGPGRTVAVLTNTRTPGLAGARNTGLALATGAFVATCDDDDLWLEGKLRKQIGLLRAEPDLIVVGSGIRLLFPAGRVVEWPGRSARITTAVLVRNRIKELHSSTLVMRRDAFAKAGRYDERLPHGYAEDYDWVLRAARVGQIGVVREPLADIRKDVPSWFRERAANTADALEYLLQTHPEIRASRPGHARVLGQIAYARASLGDRRESLRLVGAALCRYPLAPHAYLAAMQAVTGADPSVVLHAARVFKRGLS